MYNFAITNQSEFNNRTLMLPEEKEDWLQKLRSGNYKQGTGELCRVLNGVPHYCCLGVKVADSEHFEIMDLIGEYKGGHSVLPIWEFQGLSAVGNFQGFTINGRSCLTQLNDTERLDFLTIADVIEKYF